MTAYCISVTFECNWDCNYCCVDTHNKVEPTQEFILDQARSVEPGSTVSLTGGEPGLISEDFLVKILAILQEKGCRIKVNTNGMFFRKFPQYLDQIYGFLYHASIDLRNKVWLPKGYEDLNINYLIVVDDDSFPRLPTFLERNSHIEFTIRSADKCIVHGKPGSALSPSNRIKLYTQFKHLIDEEDLPNLFSRCRDTQYGKKLIRLGSFIEK